MRKGYRRETIGTWGTERLIAPNGEIVALVGIGVRGIFADARSFIEGIESRQARTAPELSSALDAMAEEHYKVMTTLWQRFHDRRKELLGDPIWGWLAFVVATAVAGLGWMS